MNIVNEKDLTTVITAFMTRREAERYVKENGFTVVGELGLHPTEPDLLPRPALVVERKKRA